MPTCRKILARSWLKYRATDFPTLMHNINNKNARNLSDKVFCFFNKKNKNNKIPLKTPIALKKNRI
jgi:hypothetical protein